jgi:hypothetical protein
METFVRYISYQEWSKTRSCSVTIAFQLCLEYAIRKVKANQEGVKMNGIHQFVVTADDVNLVGKTIYTTVFT